MDRQADRQTDRPSTRCLGRTHKKMGSIPHHATATPVVKSATRKSTMRLHGLQIHNTTSIYDILFLAISPHPSSYWLPHSAEILLEKRQASGDPGSLCKPRHEKITLESPPSTQHTLSPSVKYRRCFRVFDTDRQEENEPVQLGVPRSLSNPLHGTTTKNKQKQNKTGKITNHRPTKTQRHE